jgi:hypothetical protein
MNLYVLCVALIVILFCTKLDVVNSDLADFMLLILVVGHTSDLADFMLLILHKTLCSE